MNEWTIANNLEQLAKVLRNQGQMREAYNLADDSIVLSETTEAVDKLDGLIHQQFDPDPETWRTWSRAADELHYAAEKQGFVKGCAMAAACLLPCLLLPPIESD